MTIKNILGTALACAGTLLVASAAGITYFYRRTMIRQNAKMERTIKMAGTDWSQYKDMLARRKQSMLEQKRDDVYVQSFDDLKLHGVYFPAIKNNSDDNIISNSNSDKKRVVICMHGYTSRSMQDFTGLTDYYFKHGFAIWSQLLIYTISRKNQQQGF